MSTLAIENKKQIRKTEKQNVTNQNKRGKFVGKVNLVNYNYTKGH